VLNISPAVVFGVTVCEPDSTPSIRTVTSKALYIFTVRFLSIRRRINVLISSSGPSVIFCSSRNSPIVLAVVL